MKSSRFAAVTGASSGIGRATAEEFARHGFSLVVIARRAPLLDSLVKDLAKSNPSGRFIAAPGDITKWDQVCRLAKLVEKEFPYLNVLVNNAGAFEYQSLEKSTPEKLDEMIDVNVRGVIYMSKAFLPRLDSAVKAGTRAKIVNVSSIGGLWGFSNMSAYTATKFAVTGFSSALRRELAGRGIEVASIHPGPVQTSEEATMPKKKMVMLPHQIAGQIYSLARSRKTRWISHPAFSVLELLERISPELVDQVLKRVL